jgi:hypothetical protein
MPFFIGRQEEKMIINNEPEFYMILIAKAKAMEPRKIGPKKI